ncbi:MAG: HNH endonuclease signature motif containing protein [Euryarchaeota archaeon]|nr:HNH endonuclease signature motif containing protein [Euryarchaeota archaeon]
MEYEYKNKIRDKNKTVEKAHERVRQKSRETFSKKPTSKIGKRGYREIYVPMVGWKKEHHLVWEKNYGKIPKDFHVHHINGNPLDNRIENLQMIPEKEHHKLHDRFRKRDRKGRIL